MSLSQIQDLAIEAERQHGGLVLAAFKIAHDDFMWVVIVDRVAALQADGLQSYVVWNYNADARHFENGEYCGGGPIEEKLADARAEFIRRVGRWFGGPRCKRCGGGVRRSAEIHYDDEVAAPIDGSPPVYEGGGPAGGES